MDINTANNNAGAPAQTGALGRLKAMPRKILLRHVLDWVVLVIFAVLSLAIYRTTPPNKRVFAAFDPNALQGNSKTSVDLDNFELMPIRKEIIPVWLAAVLGFGITFICVAITQFWVRSSRDFYNAILGLSTCLIMSSFFQVTTKVLIGGTRPDFLARCQPDLSKAVGQGFGGFYYDRSVCTGDADYVSDGLESFPSGHSNCAWTSLLFLALYLNAKTKCFSARQAGVWKQAVVTLPLLLALILSLTRLLDYTHHWYDILGGSVIGIFWAFVAYKSLYAAVFDYRINHVPLTYTMDPLTGGVRGEVANGSGSAPEDRGKSRPVHDIEQGRPTF